MRQSYQRDVAPDYAEHPVLLSDAHGLARLLGAIRMVDLDEDEISHMTAIEQCELANRGAHLNHVERQWRVLLAGRRF